MKMRMRMVFMVLVGVGYTFGEEMIMWDKNWLEVG
jgi:hypothetical protein